MPRSGRPKVEFTREQIDLTKELLGEAVYPGRAVTRLAARLKLGRDTCYRLIAAAQEEVRVGLQESGSVNDPATALAMFLLSVMANGTYRVEARVGAAGTLTRLLAIGRQAAAGASAGDVEDFLAGLHARQAARKAGRATEGGGGT